MNAELGGRKWLGRTLLFQLTTAYTLSLLIAQVGTLITTGKPAPGAIPALVTLGAVVTFVILLLRQSAAPNPAFTVSPEVKGDS